MRSENGQLLMIPQQALAQMQAHAQAQPQTPVAPRPATPTSAPPVQISTVQVSLPAWSVWWELDPWEIDGPVTAPSLLTSSSP